MYRESFQHMRSRTYAILGHTASPATNPTKPGETTMTFDYGSGFTIAPGIIATAKHVLHPGGIVTLPRHGTILVLNAEDIGAGVTPINATIIAESANNDIALLRVDNPRNQDRVRLSRLLPEIGRSVGSIGFPDTIIQHTTAQGPLQMMIHFQLTFIGSHIARYLNFNLNGQIIPGFSTDGNVYAGGSGGPIYFTDGVVCGMQIGFAQTNNGERQSYTNCIKAEQIIEFAHANGIIDLDVVGTLVPEGNR